MKQGIIIGASSGIGWELAVQLAAKGYQLGLVARRLDKLEALSNSLPGDHFVVQADVSEAEIAQDELSKLIETMGNVELIVLNSGVGQQEKKLDWDIEREMIDVNIRGFAALTVVSMNYFRQRGNGHLVGISSVAAHMSGGLAPTYAATKAFVSSYLNGMRSRAEYSKLPITVTTVEPGFVDTPMVQGSPIWTATVEKAVAQLVPAILNKKGHIYITKRWRYVAWLLNIMPKWLMRRLF
ncbi:SDR family NAD(P)-dependent oxidoreductase [Porticoccaceae bacterium]|jgi:short-subunit dehydrogenase|nr:SDR family NAD(P)-dependent oxidoreductase [Porticoccaceae bacterium]MDA9014806.1 SDR family NAD(P)-dependent oxidoreductase [Porticoccaceae bacterium]